MNKVREALVVIVLVVIAVRLADELLRAAFPLVMTLGLLILIYLALGRRD